MLKQQYQKAPKRPPPLVRRYNHCIRFCSRLIASRTTNGTLRTVAYTCVTSLMWLQCTIASSTPTVHSLSQLPMCVFSHAPMSHGGDCLSDYSFLFICLIFRTPTSYDHTSHFLLLNTFLSIAYFTWGGVINPLLCIAMPGLIYIPPSDMVMFVIS
jgi:hypothetical protein